MGSVVDFASLGERGRVFVEFILIRSEGYTFYIVVGVGGFVSLLGR